MLTALHAQTIGSNTGSSTDYAVLTVELVTSHLSRQAGTNRYTPAGRRRLSLRSDRKERTALPRRIAGLAPG